MPNSTIESDSSPFLQQFKGVIATPSDTVTYDIKRWAEQTEKQAAYVVYPKDAQDISIAIKFAQAHGLPLACAGGRHNTGGCSSSEGGLVIDMRHMDAIKVDKQQSVVYLQGGCTSHQVDIETFKYGMATTVGVCGYVGVVGFATGGGLGFSLGQYGLGVDNIVSATVVLPNGEVVAASETVNEDLFWGIRGGGGNFGVIAELGMRLHPQRPDLFTFDCFFSPEKLPAVVNAINEWLPTQQPTEMISVMFMTDPATRKPAVKISGYGDFSKEEGERVWGRFFNLGAFRTSSSQIPFEQLSTLADRLCHLPGKKLNTGAHFNLFDYETAQRTYDMWTDLTSKAPFSSIMYQFHHYGKLASVPVTATAFGHRSSDKTAVIYAVWTDDNFTAEAQGYAERLKTCVSSSSTESARQSLGYSCFADMYNRLSDNDENARKIFGENYKRLQEVKRRYDPDMVFNKWFCVRPSAV